MDLALEWKIFAADLKFQSGDFVREEGLVTALIISYGSDRRAEPDDELPGNDASRRGWWGDAFNAIAGDQIGSRLWLLKRSKLTTETVQKAKEYAEEAVKWLVEDGIAKRVDVRVEVMKPSMLAIYTTITKPDGKTHEHLYNYTLESI